MGECKAMRKLSHIATITTTYKQAEHTDVQTTNPQGIQCESEVQPMLGEGDGMGDGYINIGYLDALVNR